MNSKTIKIILISFLVICIGFIAFTYLSGGDPNSDEVLTKAVSGDESEIGKDIITELTRLKSIQLDTEIFKSKVFTNLQNFALEVTPERQGRDNPFAPLGGGSVSSQTTSVSNAR